MRRRSFRRRDSIVLRLIVSIIAFSSLIAIFATAVQLFVDYRQGLKRIDSELTYAEVVTLAPISKSLWEFADETTQLQLDSLVSHPDVDYTEILVDGKTVWQAGREPEGDTVEAQYPLEFADGPFQRELGSIRIVAGLSRIYQELFDKALIILATNLLKTLAVAAFMYFLFHIYFTRHLIALGDYARRMDLKGLVKPFEFPGTKAKRQRLDEFGDIANAINLMRTNLKESYDELIESEENFRHLIEDSAQGFLILDDDRAVFANAALAQMFGFDNRDEILHIADIQELFAPWERKRLVGYREARQKGEAAPSHYEIEGIRRDGASIWLSVSAQQVTWQGRPLIGATFVDISARKQFENELVQAQKMEAVGQLTGGVAHDFNNLLTVILGNLDTARDRLVDGVKGDSRQVDLIDRSIKAAERGAALTHRLLAFSRKQSLQPTATDLNALVSGMTEMLRRTLGDSVEIRSQGAKDLWQCHADQSQLENALLNLAINARDAMPGGGTLTIETANVTLDDGLSATEAGVDPGDYVTLSVSDNGCGIAANALAHVFEPFFTTKDIGKGSGLGLSMIYGFAKQSGGNVTIRSEQGSGTTVELYLPRFGAKGDAADSNCSAANTPSSRGAA